MTRTVLVTGASRGLGTEIARQLAAAGCTVVAGARDPADGERVAADLGVHSVPLDVTDAASVDAAIAWIREHLGRLDAVVNNAAVHYDAGSDPLTEDLAVVDEAWRTNVLAAWRLIQTAAPLLREGTEPVVVNVTSELGSLARMRAHSPAYSVTKAALNATTRVFADALAPVVVQSVSPGWTATDMGGRGGRPVADGAAGIVATVLRPTVHPSGSFLADGRSVPW